MVDLFAATQPRCEHRHISFCGLKTYTDMRCVCLGSLSWCPGVYKVQLSTAQSKHKHFTQRAPGSINHLKSLEGNVISLGGLLAANQEPSISLSILIWEQLYFSEKQTVQEALSDDTPREPVFLGEIETWYNYLGFKQNESLASFL